MTNDKKMLSPAFLRFPEKGVLRPPVDTVDEIATSLAGINNPENRQYLLRNFPQSWAAQQEWLRKPSSEHDVVLVVEYDGEAVGTMGAHKIDYIHGHATTGALFWDQKHWNTGIGYRAKMVFLDYLFNRLNLRMVYSRVISFNGRSARYSEKCGYKLLATLPNHFRYGDEFADELILRVDRSDFMPLWTQFRSEYGIETTAEILERHRQVNRS